MDEVAVEHVFLPVVVVSLVIIIPPVFHAYLGLHATLTRRTNGRSLAKITFPKSVIFRKSDSFV